MDSNRHAFMAGLFILISIASVMGVMILIHGGASLLESSHHYQVYFKPGEDLSGLKAGNEVQIFGIKVGSVKGVRLDLQGESKDPGIWVDIMLASQYQLLEGAEAQARKAIMGDARILITDTGSGPVLAENATIPGSTSGIGQMISRIEGVIPKAESMMADISRTANTYTEVGEKAKELVEKVESKVDDVVARYDTLTETATQTMAEMRDILGDTKGDIRTSMANVRQITGDFREKLPDMLDNATQAMIKAREVLASARESWPKVEAVLDDTRGIAGDIKSLIEQNRVKVDRTLSTLQQASVELRGGIEDIRAAPWRLLSKPDARDQANLAVYAIARSYAQAAENLDEAIASLEAALQDPRVSDERLEAMKREIEIHYNNFNVMQTELWKRFEP